MTVQPRTKVLFSTFAAIAVPAVAAVLVAGQGGSARASASLSATGSVSAQVVHTPELVQVAAPAPVRKAAPARKATVRPTAVRKPVAATTTKVAAAPKPVVKTVAPAPAPAPKPAAKPAPAPSTGTVDDYPWRTATSGSDTWGFTKRQCVSFAAFRLAQHGNAINTSQGYGSALNWDEVARSRGVAVTSTPRVGAIAHWNANESSTVYVNGGTGSFTAGGYGHVGYVAAVYADGTALIEQYNLGGDRSYAVMKMKAPRYLVF